jgi:hypothetical protein
MIHGRMWNRIRGTCGRRMAKWFGCRPYRMRPGPPLISFTFDDFPRSALLTAGMILEQQGIFGTYYIALGLMTRVEPTGEIFRPDDLIQLFKAGHEVGCHTFDHYPAWQTAPNAYEASVIRNASKLPELAPMAAMQTHSYPINHPRPATKRLLAQRFSGCRGGGQAINQETIDLNYLNSFFLEQSRDDFGTIEQIISHNSTSGGWLIFSTHDVCENPTRFGCTPSFFEKVVRCSINSGAHILVMSAALQQLRNRV